MVTRLLTLTLLVAILGGCATEDVVAPDSDSSPVETTPAEEASTDEAVPTDDQDEEPAPPDPQETPAPVEAGIPLLWFDQAAAEADTILDDCHPSFMGMSTITIPGDSSLEEVLNAHATMEPSDEDRQRGLVRTPYDEFDLTVDSATVEGERLTVEFADPAVFDRMDSCDRTIVMMVLQHVGNGVEGVTEVAAFDDRIVVPTN